ncbi:hypothetical protein GcC1_200013 [Golovinomyces cichoracearum]|uniref:Uncharacterized protein n=1 Tax=Golovinomyces cichoracearum TaxID=62708 RepID=A0A420HEF7_9PEZI|nr:hypothetical protein GcC1_200013 [Golovinomyces cichoracearum]
MSWFHIRPNYNFDKEKHGGEFPSGSDSKLKPGDVHISSTPSTSWLGTGNHRLWSSMHGSETSISIQQYVAKIPQTAPSSPPWIILVRDMCSTRVMFLTIWTPETNKKSSLFGLILYLLQDDRDTTYIPTANLNRAFDGDVNSQP